MSKWENIFKALKEEDKKGNISWMKFETKKKDILLPKNV